MEKILVIEDNTLSNDLMDNFEASLQKPISKSLLDIRQLMHYLPASQWIFWKNLDSTYAGCSESFSGLFGVQPKNLVGLKVADFKYLNNRILSNNAKELEEIDHRIIDLSESYELKTTVNFEKYPVAYELSCKAFPLVNDSERVLGLLVIGYGSIINLSGNTDVFCFVTKKQIVHLLTLSKYNLISRSIRISLTRREVACLLYLMKGKTAKEIAFEMEIGEKTAVGYIYNLKDKFGCFTKSELIALAFESSLLDEIQKSRRKESSLIIDKITHSTCLYNDDQRIFIKV